MAQASIKLIQVSHRQFYMLDQRQRKQHRDMHLVQKREADHQPRHLEIRIPIIIVSGPSRETQSWWSCVCGDKNVKFVVCLGAVRVRNVVLPVRVRVLVEKRDRISVLKLCTVINIVIGSGGPAHPTQTMNKSYGARGGDVGGLAHPRPRHGSRLRRWRHADTATRAPLQGW